MTVYLDSSAVLCVLLRQPDPFAALPIATHDGQQATAARALGFECVGI